MVTTSGKRQWLPQGDDTAYIVKGFHTGKWNINTIDEFCDQHQNLVAEWTKRRIAANFKKAWEKYNAWKAGEHRK
jgi:hypothetical protein